MRNILIYKTIQKPLIAGVFANNIQSVYKYAKYEAPRCQEYSHAHTVMTFISPTSYWGCKFKIEVGTYGHSDKKTLFCFVFQKKLYTFALAFIINRL